MFTGLVEEIGTILCRELTGLLIHAPSGFADVTCKERLAVDGACLVVIERGENWFHMQSMPEVLRCSRAHMSSWNVHFHLMGR